MGLRDDTRFVDHDMAEMALELAKGSIGASPAALAGARLGSVEGILAIWAAGP